MCVINNLGCINNCKGKIFVIGYFLFDKTSSLVLAFLLYSMLDCLGIRCCGLGCSYSRWFMNTPFLSDVFSGLQSLVIEGFIQVPQGMIHAYAHALNSY
jgi:hypothetical protein